jgi:hypothetical protein
MSFDWWMSALEMAGDYGKLTREQMAALGCHEDEPQPGFWRVPPTRHFSSDEAFVAIWHDGQDMRAVWDGAPIDPTAAWSWCLRYPIEEERYRAAERRGFTHLSAFGT